MLATGAVLAAVDAGQAAAASCGSSTAAANVYKECPTDGGGGSSGGNTSTTGTQPGSSAPQHLSNQSKKALNQAGKDKKALALILKTSGNRRRLASETGPASTPSTVGSAFDLGSGPTALLIVLAGTAFLLLGGSGLRTWRSRRRA